MDISWAVGYYGNIFNIPFGCTFMALRFIAINLTLNANTPSTSLIARIENIEFVIDWSFIFTCKPAWKYLKCEWKTFGFWTTTTMNTVWKRIDLPVDRERPDTIMMVVKIKVNAIFRNIVLYFKSPFKKIAVVKC